MIRVLRANLAEKHDFYSFFNTKMLRKIIHLLTVIQAAVFDVSL